MLLLDQINRIEPVRFKDTALFKALEAHPKVHDKSECEKCEGYGQCHHCKAKCEDCDGEGEVEDSSLPKVYTDKATIQIGDQYLTPLRLGKLEKVLLELSEETFELIGKSGATALFKVGEVEILIAQAIDRDQFPNFELAPIQQKTPHL